MVPFPGREPVLRVLLRTSIVSAPVIPAKRSASRNPDRIDGTSLLAGKVDWIRAFAGMKQPATPCPPQICPTSLRARWSLEEDDPEAIRIVRVGLL